jgi:hypothetical protein
MSIKSDHLVGPTDLNIIAKAFTVLFLYEDVTLHLIRYRELVSRIIDGAEGRHPLEMQIHRLDLAKANAEIARRTEVLRRHRA